MMVTLSAENPYKVYTQGLPFEMPEVNAPQIPDRQVLLSDYDADGTGQRLCTDAFARAITALTAKGGGRLVVPSGIWLTGPIVLKSNIDLHLEHGKFAGWRLRFLFAYGNRIHRDLFSVSPKSQDTAGQIDCNFFLRCLLCRFRPSKIRHAKQKHRCKTL